MPTEEQVIAQTRNWVQQIVLRHNFCPFAHQPFRNDTIRYSVNLSSDPEGVVESLIHELTLLRDAERETLETTIVVTPHCFDAFEDYNQFLNVVDELIEQLHLAGEIQVASFHPDYQFADLPADDVRNYTNRSLYPMFHLILESSIEAARTSHPDVGVIPEDNMKLLAEMGLEEAQRQLAACRKN
ncbi:MAG TPA: DUF1415 domain-containing protein [Candidatus Tenderia sp.]|nr:DUF1415 domain-containing protein [Candidatus Tenderia sp.]